MKKKKYLYICLIVKGTIAVLVRENLHVVASKARNLQTTEKCEIYRYVRYFSYLYSRECRMDIKLFII